MKRVFASLASGRLCVFSRKSIGVTPPGPVGDAEVIPDACIITSDPDFREEANDWADPLILRLADASGMSAKCMVFVGGDRLWCGCGNFLTVVDSVNLRVLHKMPVFVRRMALVNELVSNKKRVWGIGRHLSCVMEWDAETYTLLHVFNCGQTDPSGTKVIANPRQFEDLFDPETQQQQCSSKGIGGGGSGDSSPVGSPSQDRKFRTDSQAPIFDIRNDPTEPSISSPSPFSQRSTRCTLRNITPRARTRNLKESLPTRPTAQQQHQSMTSMSARRQVLHKQHGSTRTTSLAIVDQTLWVGRGMGDVLVLDISGGGDHGTVLVRMASEDCIKYGNRSYHKLVLVANEYVVSSQWLEPVELRKSYKGRDSDEPFLCAHQEVTIWEAWSHKRIQEFNSRKRAMLAEEENFNSSID